MRSEEDVIQFTEAMRRCDRLVHKAIQAGASDTAIFQDVKERVFIHNASPSRVQEIGVRLHQRQLRLSHEAAGFP
jgi:hypothetical protein